MGDIWMGLFKTLFDRIAAELFSKTHGVRTMMSSSKVKQFFLSDMPVVRLI